MHNATIRLRQGSLRSLFPSHTHRLICAQKTARARMKRTATNGDGSLSPPPVRRKIDSTTTSTVVSSFFTPASEKQPEKFVWKIVQGTLIVGRHNNPAQKEDQLSRPVKIAAFDLDDTVIKPKNGNRFARSANTHDWWNAIVPARLKQLHDDGYLVVFLTNQGGISLKTNAKSLQKDSLSLKNFKDQLVSLLRKLDFPISVYAATANDKFRKPRIGMWEQIQDDFGLEADGAIDLDHSFYIGDAAGREKTDKRRKDHATSDRDLAANIGIKFQTPEEFFLGIDTEPYVHPFEPKHYLESAPAAGTVTEPFQKKSKQELVIFCGSPGAGKSSYYWRVLQPQGYERVNQDILKTRDRCIKVARQLLESGSSVVVDNTNRDKDARAHWVKVSKEFHVPIRCILFSVPPRVCEHNDMVRALNSNMNPEDRVTLPAIAFTSFAKAFVPPELNEGFEDITIVHFKFQGSDVERSVWSKHWVSTFAT